MKKRKTSHDSQEYVSESHDELDMIKAGDLKMEVDTIGLSVDDQILFTDDEFESNEQGALAFADDDLLQFTDDDSDPGRHGQPRTHALAR